MIQGKRMCIGADLGRITVFLFTVSVLQRFRLDFPPGFNFDTNQKPDYGFTLVPPPYRIRVKRRSLWNKFNDCIWMIRLLDPRLTDSIKWLQRKSIM